MTDAIPAIAKPRAYSYLRFSTPEQMNGDSFRRQSTMAAAYAGKHGLELDVELTFHDLGKSAFRGQNVGEAGRLGDFLEAVKVGLVPAGSMLLVEQLDRISRQSARKALRVLEDIVDAGVSVATMNDGRVYSQASLDNEPMDLLIAILTFIRANDESATKSRRLSQAWEAKRATAATKPLTSRVPAWLRLDGTMSTFQLVPERAALVERIFALTVQGVGQHKIAETLNREGVKPWGSATHWQRSYVSKILGNPAVIGTMTPHLMDHDGAVKRRRALDPLEGYYPAAVSRETWSHVRALQEAGAATRGRPAVSPVSNMLAGLAACPSCGGRMTRVQKGARSRPSLVCTKAKVRAGCPYKSVRCDLVEDALLRDLPPRLESLDGVELDGTLEQEIVSADHFVDYLKEAASNLLDNLQHGPSPAIAARLRGTEMELEEAQERLGGLLERRDAASGPLVASRIARALEALQPAQGPMQPAVANAALRGIFKRAVINWPQGTIDLEWTHGGLCIVPYGLSLQG